MDIVSYFVIYLRLVFETFCVPFPSSDIYVFYSEPMPVTSSVLYLLLFFHIPFYPVSISIQLLLKTCVQIVDCRIRS